MCIACELGYWAMVDAIEAERKTSRSLAEDGGNATFNCGPVDIVPVQNPDSARSADESDS